MGVTMSNLSPAADAASNGDAENLVRLLDEGVDVNETSGCEEVGVGMTLLQHAASRGHANIVELLLYRGADVNKWSFGDDPNVTEVVAVQCAAEHGHLDCLTLLLAADGVNLTLENDQGRIMDSAVQYAFQNSCSHQRFATISIIATLRAFGASIHPSWATEREMFLLHYDRNSFRVPLIGSMLETRVAEDCRPLPPMDGVDEQSRYRNIVALKQWLEQTRAWYKPLHFLEHLPVMKAQSLLRAGASIHARLSPSSPSPLDRACSVLMQPEGTPGRDAAAIVYAASQDWSTSTHRLWPEGGRKRAVELLMAVYQIVCSGPFADEAGSLKDVLLDVMIPHAMPARTAYEEPSKVISGLVSDAIRGAKQAYRESLDINWDDWWTTN